MLLEEHQIAATIIFLISSFGMTCNWFVALFIPRLPSLQNAFGRLTCSQALAEAIHLSIFCLLISPMIFFDIKPMMEISQHFGHALVICYDNFMFCHLLISLNRFTAIYIPLKYDKLFSFRNTMIMIGIAWTIANVPTIYTNVIADCHFYYEENFWHFAFSNNDVCNAIAWYDFVKYVTIVIVVVLIDFITVFRVHMVNSEAYARAGQSNRRRADEINFLKQACLQAGVFVCELLTYFVFANYFEGRWIKFVLSTVAWTLVHTIDGVITISFNREFRKLLGRKISSEMLLEEHQIAAIIIFLISSFGMTCNWFVVLFIPRLPSLQNAFGRLTCSQALAEAIHLSIFCLLVSPMIFFDIKPMMEISQHFGHVLLICYDICIFCHLFISLNRFTAIYLPYHYDTLFRFRNTVIMMALAWIVASVPTIYTYMIVDCHLYYEGTFWHFVFSNNDACNAISWYDFVKYVTIVIVIVLIDIITVLRVHMVNSEAYARSGQSNRRRADEINFLKQACLQAGVFVCELLNYFVFVNFFEGRWIKFVLSTVAWILVHTLDGVITISFNREFRKLLGQKFGSAKSIVGTQTSTLTPFQNSGSSPAQH